LMGEDSSYNRRDLNINIPADPSGTTNIIPVDYVAKAAVRLIEDPNNHNRIFHLTHPDPPTHQWTLDLICERFNLGGFRFAGAGAPFTQPRNRVERMVWRQMQAILFHFSNNPGFDRTNIDSALPDLKVPQITEDLVHKYLDYAIERDWGHSGN
ncbi:MAG: hypothetical protein HY912_16480, partial [Desulfomonile tiedjei]|nr:hypothetical protein [Desulfomonile tiedjei]